METKFTWISAEKNQNKKREKKGEPIPQTMKLVFDFQSVLDRLGIPQRELERGTQIRFATINDYIVGDYKMIVPDNIAHMIEYLWRNYGVEWTEIVKFVPMTEEEIQEKIREKEERKKNPPKIGRHAKKKKETEPTDE